MFFRFVYLNTGLNRFHSTDLTDMRHAIAGEEDQEGPDGGTPHLRLLRSAREGRAENNGGLRKAVH